jgi:hypothetical protein
LLGFTSFYPTYRSNFSIGLTVKGFEGYSSDERIPTLLEILNSLDRLEMFNSTFEQPSSKIKAGSTAMGHIIMNKESL